LVYSYRPHKNITRSMRIACWITKATVKHLEYIILTNFPQQQWLSERISMFVCRYILCIFTNYFFFS